MNPPAADAHAINFAWLVRLRWGSVAGQVGTVLVVDRLMGIPLPLLALLSVIAVEATTNVLCTVVSRRGAPRAREWWLVAAMVLDTLVLTVLLALAGGPLNPFSFLYLVQIALAAVVLREQWTWLLVLLSVAGSAVLFAVHLPLPLGATHEEHMRYHLQGMWVAFVVAAAFIVYFLMRVSRALSAREADLASARRAAERQEKLASLATLAAGAAHELSTPLGTIALVARELERQLQQGGAAAPLVEDAGLIRAQVQRCREILERMAADAGESAGEAPVPVAVAQLLDGARAQLADSPPILVEVHSDPGDALRLPPRAVAQALRGLLKNAQEATAAAGSAEPVHLRATVDGDGVRIEVRDHGAGMTADVLARAGEPFFTTKAPGRGMGLGLFLSRVLVQRLGGELAIDSRPGDGTTVQIRLPLDREPAAKSLRMATPAAS